MPTSSASFLCLATCSRTLFLFVAHFPFFSSLSYNSLFPVMPRISGHFLYNYNPSSVSSVCHVFPLQIHILLEYSLLWDTFHNIACFTLSEHCFDPRSQLGANFLPFITIQRASCLHILTTLNIDNFPSFYYQASASQSAWAGFY